MFELLQESDPDRKIIGNGKSSKKVGKPKAKKTSDTEISEQKPLGDGLGSGNNQEWVGRREDIIDVPPPLAPPYHHHR